MHCFECARAGRETSAVAVCRDCGAGLCLEHVAANERDDVSGMQMGCAHDLSRGLATATAGKGNR
jgi:hypothetical protein